MAEQAKPKSTGKQVTVKASEIPFATDGFIASVPTIFADAIRGAAVTQDVARLNLVEYKLDPRNSSMAAKVVLSLALPKGQIRAWSKYLAKVADDNDL